MSHLYCSKCKHVTVQRVEYISTTVQKQITFLFHSDLTFLVFFYYCKIQPCYRKTTWVAPFILY